jgi:hypothetical protein
MYTSTTNYNNPHIGYSPVRHSTYMSSPVRTISNSVVTHPAPLGHSSHNVDPYGDAIVSYGVDEFGEPIRIVSTGILYGPEIKTFTERVAPGETTTSNHVSRSYLNPFEAQENHTTVTDVTSPSRYYKTTTYSPSRIRPVHHEFAPIDIPMTKSTSTTTTRHLGSPYRQVTTSYHPEQMSPVRSAIVS